MLYLVFHLGTERYVLPANRIVEMLPAVEARPLPGTLPAIVGVFNYRGHQVPLVDLRQLVLGQPVQLWLSSRIVLVRDAVGEHLMGLLVERATETLQLEPMELVASDDNWKKASYLGPVVMNRGGVIQVMELDELLALCRVDHVEENLLEMAGSNEEIIPATEVPL